jgi:hypothetical protein
MQLIDKPQDKRPDPVEKISHPLAVVLTVGAGVLRLLPLPPNFQPAGAVGLFGGARLRTWQALALPLAMMLVSDGFLAILKGPHYVFHPATPFIYASFLVYVLIGRALRNTESPLWIGCASLLGSVQFFLISNFGHWLMTGVPAGSKSVLDLGQYYLTVGGLIECYTQALPFFRTTLVSDLLFTGLFFGLHALLTRLYFTAERVKVQKDRR